MNARLFHRRDHLPPAQARRSLAWPFTVPPGVGELRLRLAFWPGQVGQVRNLLTITLFDPHGFRGAGHRHAPHQEIVINAVGATPGFLPGEIAPGSWTVEVDCHCVLPSTMDGLGYELEVIASFSTRPGGTDLPAPVDLPPTRAAETEGTGPHTIMPAWEPDAAPGQRPGAGLPGAGLSRAGRRGGGGAGGASEGPRWLKGDLHLHSNHSDGRWGVDALARYVAAHELDFISLTDHNTVSATDDLEKAMADAGLGVVLIPGMELTTYYGHANALGVDGWVDWRVTAPPGLPGGETAGCAEATVVPGRTMGQAAAEVRRRGGTFVINHPRSPGYPSCTGCRWEFGEESAAYADLLEVWNGPWAARGQNAEALALWNGWLNAGHRLPAVAGSDGHTSPRRPDQLGFTYAFASPDTPSLLAALRAGRTYLSAGPALIWRQPQPGATLPAGAEEVTVDVGGLATAAELCLVAAGETVERRTVTGDDTVSFRLPGSASRGASGSALGAPAPPAWFRVELYRQQTGAILALTNPLFRDLTTQ